MNTLQLQLQDAWTSVKRAYPNHEGGYQLIRARHPLEWMAGYATSGHKALMAICNVEPRDVPASKSITGIKRKRTDGRWTFSLNLEDSAQESVFMALCADLIEYTQTVSTEEEALQFLANRYHQWSKLLASGKTGHLNSEACRGLMGELYFLAELVRKGLSRERALRGWVGPNGHNQDFVFEDGWYEIKTTATSSTCIMISSLQQLARDDIGYLVVVYIDECAPDQQFSLSLGEMVERTRNLFADDIELLSLLEEKLISYGYIEQNAYYKQKYIIIDKATYVVDSVFPKLIPRNVPKQVIKLQYSIDLVGIENWHIED